MLHDEGKRGRLNTFGICSCALSAALACSMQANAQPLAPWGHSQFHADTNLILVPVTVMDARGSNIQGLGVRNFTVLDDRQPRPIVAFYSEDTPASIGIVVDVSGSTMGVLEQEKALVRCFLELSHPEDDFFLATVSSSPRLVADRVSNPREIDNLLLWEKPGGGTALCDTAYLALHQARLRPRPRRVLLVISDGMDNHSRYSKQELMREVLESDTQIYAVGLDNARVGLKGIPLAEVRGGLAFLDELADESGGLSLRLKSDRDPSAAAATISAAIRNQYVLGFQSPDNDSSERRHRIQVKVDLPKASVHARTGYQLR